MSRARSLGSAITGMLAIGAMAGPAMAQTTRPSNGPTTRQSPRRTEELYECERCGRHIGAVLQALTLYSNDNKGRLPEDLGAGFAGTSSLKQLAPGTTLTPALWASFYLCPSHAKGIEIPEKPTAQWINQNTSYVYLGSNRVRLGAIRRITETVLVYEKPDAPHPGGRIWVAFVDGHRVHMSIKEARQAIEASKPRIAAAAQ